MQFVVGILSQGIEDPSLERVSSQQATNPDVKTDSPFTVWCLEQPSRPN
jgi:hypothetical protein